MIFYSLQTFIGLHLIFLFIINNISFLQSLFFVIIIYFHGTTILIKFSDKILILTKHWVTLITNYNPKKNSDYNIHILKNYFDLLRTTTSINNKEL